MELNLIEGGREVNNCIRNFQSIANLHMFLKYLISFKMTVLLTVLKCLFLLHLFTKVCPISSYSKYIIV